MRELLFRGKSTDTGEWVEGDFCRPCNICFEQTDEDGEAEWHDCAVDPSTVGQFVGLTDRNGMRIFEGDVVRHHRELWGRDDSEIGEVCWDETLCRFYRTAYPAPENAYAANCKNEPVLLSADITAFYEVVGNIHDDPALVEGVKGNGRL